MKDIQKNPLKASLWLKPGAFSHSDTMERNAPLSVSLVQPESQSSIVQQVVSPSSILHVWALRPATYCL